jgi:hypothetical protein
MNSRDENENELLELDMIYREKIDESKKKIKNKQKLIRQNKTITETLLKAAKNIKPKIIVGKAIEGPDKSPVSRKPTKLERDAQRDDQREDRQAKITSQKSLGEIPNSGPGLSLEPEGENFLEKYYHLEDINISFDAAELEEFSCLLQKKGDRAPVYKDLYKDVPCDNSCFLLTKKNNLRRLCAYLGSHALFETVVLTIII